MQLLQTQLSYKLTRHLCSSSKSSRAVLDDVSIKISAGETACVVGRTGRYVEMARDIRAMIADSL
jgi:ABC-type multidrug transport system fused ATPase/permease subunit